MICEVVAKDEMLCKWCGLHLWFKKRGTRGQFCNNDHGRLYRKRQEAKAKAARVAR